MTADARHIPITTTPYQRHWHDLHKGRLVLGLLASPVLPILLGGLLPIAFVNRAIPLKGLAISFGIVEAVAGTWSLAIGFAALALRARANGQVGRVDCFVLGILLAASLPFAVWACGLAFDATTPLWDGDKVFFFAPDDVKFALLFGLLLMPFGLLGGWIFWRLGVRPAVPRALDVTGVFE